MATLLPLVGIVLLFWLFIIRPTTRRQKELRTMQSSLTVGAEVVLTSGVYGTVREVEEDGDVHVEIANGVVIKVVSAAVGRIVPPEEPEDGVPVALDEHDPAEQRPAELESAEHQPDGVDAPNDDAIADERRSEEN